MRDSHRIDDTKLLTYFQLKTNPFSPDQDNSSFFQIFQMDPAKPLTFNQTMVYIQFLLNAAGPGNKIVIEEDAHEALYRLTEGQVGQINTLMEQALDRAYGERTQRIGQHHVEDTGDKPGVLEDSKKFEAEDLGRDPRGAGKGGKSAKSRKTVHIMGAAVLVLGIAAAIWLLGGDAKPPSIIEKKIEPKKSAPQENLKQIPEPPEPTAVPDTAIPESAAPDTAEPVPPVVPQTHAVPESPATTPEPPAPIPAVPPPAAPAPTPPATPPPASADPPAVPAVVPDSAVEPAVPETIIDEADNNSDPEVRNFLAAYDLQAYGQQFSKALWDEDFEALTQKIYAETGLMLIHFTTIHPIFEKRYRILGKLMLNPVHTRYFLFWKPAPVIGAWETGTRGTGVRQVQTMLKKIGIYRGAIDGVVGIELNRAILRFQGQNFIEETGTPDPTTLFFLTALSR